MKQESEELQVAINAARVAGAITLEKFGELSHPEIQLKQFKDFVTVVDKACEAAISSTIAASFPDDSMLCEEGTVMNGSSGRTWIVDPLDGTLNFIHSFPVFSISIALRDSKNKLLAGVVYQPALDELFTAEAGEGAYLNGKKIAISSRTDKESFLMATGLPFSQYHYLDSTLSCAMSFTTLPVSAAQARRQLTLPTLRADALTAFGNSNSLPGILRRVSCWCAKRGGLLLIFQETVIYSGEEAFLLAARLPIHCCLRKR